MDVIPAIDLLDGQCVRLNQGNYNKVTNFNSDPLSQALLWQQKGAKLIHIVDLNAAKTGKPENDSTIRKIRESINIPIQIGGGVRTFERAQELLEIGIDKVILGTVAIENPSLIDQLANLYPQKIIIGIDAKSGKVATRGWITQSEILATDLVKQFTNKNIAAIITTDIATDGTLRGPNIKALKEISSLARIPVIASGGIGSIADLLSLISLEQYGVTGIIIGRALYDGAIELEEAIRAISQPRIQDPPTNSNYFV